VIPVTPTPSPTWRFYAGDAVPEWLLCQVPMGAGSQPGEMRFLVVCDVVQLPSRVVVIPEPPTRQICDAIHGEIIDMGGAARVQLWGTTLDVSLVQGTFTISGMEPSQAVVDAVPLPPQLQGQKAARTPTPGLRQLISWVGEALILLFGDRNDPARAARLKVILQEMQDVKKGGGAKLRPPARRPLRP
jgi:hypothetical protein